MSETVVQKQILERSHLEMLEKLLNTMQYGNITLIVQDGKIIQIEKTEKYRLKD
ncbi:MAG: YezD family protein [Ruminococcus sp.]|nr:YezD family protein [Ruminococcus sp.]MDE5584507.1 YezD family protein [Ruminococcus sp.]MDE5770518.1 YezD family protein [Ruminococcus sp.]